MSTSWGRDPDGRPGQRPDARLDARLVPAAALAWAVAGWAVAAPTAAVAASAVAAAALAAALVALRRAASAAVGLALAAAVCASVLSTQVASGRGLLEPLAAQGATAVVRGSAASDALRVRADPARPWASADPRWVVRLTADGVTGRGGSSTARARVLVVGGEGWGAVRRGDRVAATGRLAVTEPGDRAAALLTAARAPELGPPEQRWAQLAQRLRAGLVAACAPLPADARGLLPGLVVGDVTALPTDLDDAMRATGLTHLTAVSGSSTALVTGAVLAVAAAAGAGRRTRLLLAGGALLAFAVLAGGEPSVLRATATGAAVLVGAATSRRAGGLPALAAAAGALLVLDPWMARSAGFALSVLATGALLVLAPAWTEALLGAVPVRRARRSSRLLARGVSERRAHRLARGAAAAVAVPLAAQAVCAPVVVLLAPGVPLLAVPANLLVAPAVAPATLLGLAATLLQPLWPGAAGAAAHLGGLAAQWVALVARTGAAAPGASLPWPQGPGPALALAAVGVLLGVAPGLLLRRRRGVPSGAPGRDHRGGRA